MGSTIWFLQRIESSYRKTSFAITLLNHFILLLPIHRVALQFQKVPLHKIQLPIIKIPNKMEVSNPSPLPLLPQISHSCLFCLG